MITPNKLFKGFWCQKVLPLVYDDSLSYYEVLCKLKQKLNEVIETQTKVIDQVNLNTTDIAAIKTEIAGIQAEIQKIENGEYSAMYVNALNTWLTHNGPSIIQKIVKFVQFGLTGDGYFCALVPYTWDFIKWDTIVDPASPLDGHLVLRW